MNISMTGLLWTILGIVVFVFLYLWNRYNAFVSQRNRVEADFADIDVQLKRRASLIENLVAVVREYAKHEKSTFSEVAKARSSLEQPHGPKDSAQADNMLTSALRSLFAVSEAYPKLQASQNYQTLQADIKETEDLIAQNRETYNQTVLDYNTMVQTFPNLIVASLFGFEQLELFQIEEESRKEIKLA